MQKQMIQICYNMLQHLGRHEYTNVGSLDAYPSTASKFHCQLIEYIQEDLKNIDSTGHFESDDEIGTIFQQIKSTLEQLNELKGV